MIQIQNKEKNTIPLKPLLSLNHTHLKYLIPIGILFLLIFPSALAAQLWKFDGNNCDSSDGNPAPYDEWGTPLVVDGADVTPGSADIVNFWAFSDDQDFYVAFNRVSKGNSGFTFYLNTDCDTTTGDTRGSEFALFFTVSSGVVSTKELYEWDPNTSAFVLGTKTFDALIGESECGNTGTDELFFEMKFPIATLFDPCDTAGNGCGFITVELGSTNAGGSFNSSIKDTFLINIPFAINLPPTGVLTFSDSIACTGDVITFDGTSSLDGNQAIGAPDSLIAYDWDMSYDGVTFNVDSSKSDFNVTYTANSQNIVALRVTDKFGCTSRVIVYDTIDVYARPESIISLQYNSSDTNQCKIVGYNGKASNDNNGASNLVYSWDFNDGVGVSSLDSGTYNYADCYYYTVSLTVTDPDNPTKCASDISFNPIVLPINIIFFNANIDNNDNVVLDWGVEDKLSNLGWEVQRSKNARNWINKGFVNADRTALGQYTWIDEKPLNGINYYRLKQKDKNGEYSFSKVRYVVFNKSFKEFTISPNPVDDFITLSFPSFEENEIQEIGIYDQSGKMISSNAVNLKNMNSLIDVSKLKSGIYYIKVSSQQGLSSQLFIKN